jgi:ABC-type multidrug transport system fused ATPase/permease subunit
MGVLGATTAAYAWTAGPLLGALYGADPPPWPALDALTARFGSDPAARVWALGGLLAAVTLVRALARYGHDVAVLRLEQTVLHDARLRLHAHLLALPAMGAGGGRHGDLASRVTLEVDRLRVLIRQAVAGLGRNGLTALALLGVAFSIDATITAIALLALPPLLLAVRRLAERARRAERASLRSQSALSGLAAEVATLRPLVRAYGAERIAQDTFARYAVEAREAAMQATRTRSLLAPCLDVLGAAGILLALGITHGRVAEGVLSAQGAISLLAALILLYRPFQSVAGILQGFSVGLASVDRLREVLALPTEPADQAEAADPPPLAEGIVLDGVHAGYGDSPDVLRGLSLTIRAGEAVAVVGMSGVGKTTLLLLLMGLLRPRRGAIRVDGVPLTAVRQQAWRRRTAWVPQEPMIFSDTALSNIALGDPRPDRTRAEAAARAAGAHAFVRDLAHGYDTVLQEGGRDLSMGQRQRLCLARALYRQAPLLLLDEPTASLDGEAERILSDSIAGLIGDHTVLLASHRERTVRHMDRVVVLADGRVVDEGTPAELAARGGVYRTIFPDDGDPGAPATEARLRAIGSQP